MAHSIIVEGDDVRPPADDPRRALAESWTPDDDAFECCCAVCSSQDQ
jgi:hypothetical protein